LEEKLGAVGFELTADELREIRSAALKITVHGNRYREPIGEMTGLWTGDFLRQNRFGSAS